MRGRWHGSEELRHPGEARVCGHVWHTTTHRHLISATCIELIRKLEGVYRGKIYLKDCPQRNVVLIQSSVRLVGSLYHSAARNAMLLSCLRSIAPQVNVDSPALGDRDTVAGRACQDAKSRFLRELVVSPRRRQHHHPSKHRVLELGPLPEAIISAVFDLGLLIAAD